MFVLDSDHMSFLNRPESVESKRVRQRMAQASAAGVVSTVVAYEEQTRGWLAYVAKAKSIERLIDAYKRLEGHLTVYREMPVLSFNEAAAVRFQDLKQSRINVGTVDLRIAAIALVNDAVLVSRNLRDFGRVPGLKVEDWTIELRAP